MSDNTITKEIEEIVEEKIQKSLVPVEFPDVQKVEIINEKEPVINISTPEIKVPEPKVTVNVKPPEITVKAPDIDIPEPIDNSEVLNKILDAISNNKPLPFDVEDLSDEMRKVVDAVKGIRITGHGGVSSKRNLLDLSGKAINPATKESTTYQKTAFDELAVAESSPIVQVQFPYNINTDIWEIRNNGGTSSVVDNKANLSTGAGANQSSTILSKTPIKYNPGQGALVRFTAVFTTGVAGNTQYVGIGNTTDGYFFGYTGATFGILRRQGGLPETRRLAITTASNTNEDIIITLNGVAETVAVTATGGNTDANKVTTANEIAAHDFSNVGEGWEVHNMGVNIFFTSFGDGSKTGTFSLVNGGGEAVGTFAQSLAGVNATEDTISQTAWNKDKMDGSGSSGINLDSTKGNVYQIRYQWLGFGAISFYIENPSTGELILVHRIEYGNANTIPSVDNPTLPLCASSKNIANTSDIVLQVGSMGGFVEGRDTLKGLPHSLSVETTGITTTETPTMTIHSHDIYQGTINRVKIKMTVGSISVDGTKNSIIRIRKNAVITGPVSFSPLNSNTSTIHQDTTATGVSGGTIVFAQGATKVDELVIDLEKLGLELVAPDFLTVTVQATSAATLDAVTTLNLQELF